MLKFSFIVKLKPPTGITVPALYPLNSLTESFGVSLVIISADLFLFVFQQKIEA